MPSGILPRCTTDAIFSHLRERNIAGSTEIDRRSKNE